MAAYVVMARPDARGGRESDDVVFLRDGFSIPAFIVPPLWLAWHRLWIEAFLALAATVVLTALGETTGFALAGAALSLLVSLYVGLEGQALRAAALARRGWRQAAVIEAHDEADAEIRFFAAEDANEADMPPPVTEQPPRATWTPSRGAPALGLLSYPGRS